MWADRATWLGGKGFDSPHWPHSQGFSPVIGVRAKSGYPATQPLSPHTESRTNGEYGYEPPFAIPALRNVTACRPASRWRHRVAAVDDFGRVILPGDIR